MLYRQAPNSQLQPQHQGHFYDKAGKYRNTKMVKKGRVRFLGLVYPDACACIATHVQKFNVSPGVRATPPLSGFHRVHRSSQHDESPGFSMFVIGDDWSIRLFLGLGESLVVGLCEGLGLTLLAVLNSCKSSVSFPAVSKIVFGRVN